AVRPEREVEDLDAVAVLERDRPLDAGDDVAHVGGAVPPGELDRHQVGPGGDARVGAVGGGAVAGDQTGDEGAVAVGVAAARLAREVHAGAGGVADVVGDGEAPAGRVGEVGVPGVEEGNGAAAAVDAGLPHVVGVDDLGVDRVGRALVVAAALDTDGPVQ